MLGLLNLIIGTSICSLPTAQLLLERAAELAFGANRGAGGKGGCALPSRTAIFHPVPPDRENR